MWGNRLGWTIAAFIAIAIVGLVTWVHLTAHDLSPRTEITSDPRATELLVLPVSPKTVLPAMTAASDAGPIYRRAIAMYLADVSTYSAFARSGRERDLEDVPAINILAQATPCETADIFQSDPTKIVTLVNEKPELDALIELAVGARRAGMLIQSKKPAEALALYEAVFSLGAKLFRERLTYQEMDAGLTMMAEGSALIGALNPDRAAACRQFDEARRAYVNTRILPLQKILHTLDQPTIERHAGDVFYLARHAQDRMWQVEAIFATARYRFNAGRYADQKAAMRILESLSKDPDPIVRTAAIEARDMTEQRYRMLR
jgi:hypothetical protein